MNYGEKEFSFAEPLANALVNDPFFRSWVLLQTEFADHANNVRVLNEEMKAQRSAVSKNWWRSHFTESCRCFGCSGQETDLLAIFEGRWGERFALHFEVKHPGDTFKEGGHQAESYPIRAKCWATAETKPPKVLPHTLASTVLLCSETKLEKFAPHTPFFASVITFEDIKKDFSEFWGDVF